jgi:hypothetical protein
MKDLLETVKFFFPKDEIENKDVISIREILEELYYEGKKNFGIFETSRKKEILQIAKDINKLKVIIADTENENRLQTIGNSLQSKKVKKLVADSFKNNSFNQNSGKTDTNLIYQALNAIINNNKQYPLAVFVSSLIQDEYSTQEIRWVISFLIPFFLSLFTGLTVGIITTFLTAYLRVKLNGN